MRNGNGEKIFEVGSGIGAIVSIYSERGFGCIRSDISTYTLERTKKLNPHITLYLVFFIKPMPPHF